MMNGVTKMYKMQPVIDHDLKINLPSCMFQMRNVHSREKEVGTKITEGRIPTSYENMDTFDQVIQFLKVSNFSIHPLRDLELFKYL